MKKILIALVALSIQIGASAQTVNSKYYCVQVTSTKNPHLLRRGMLIARPTDTALLEEVKINGQKMWRVIFAYKTPEEQEEALATWLREYKDALRCTRTRSEIESMALAFDESK
jgi:hypothetical protein